MTGDQIIATAALSGLLVSILINILMWREGRRSANAAERSAAVSERSAAAAERSAEAAERTAEDGGRLTAMQIDQRHEELRPYAPSVVEAFAPVMKGAPAQSVVRAVLLIESGDGSPREYRPAVTARTHNSTRPIDAPFTIRAGQSEELVLDTVDRYEPFQIVRLSLRFWPNTPASGSATLGTWDCPCKLGEHEDGHWRASVDVDSSLLAEPKVYNPLDFDEEHTF